MNQIVKLMLTVAVSTVVWAIGRSFVDTLSL
jgi:hypothetical protein